MMQFTAQPNIIVRIGQPGARAPLSKAQKKFNQLTRKIAGLREQLQAWQALGPVFQAKLTNEIEPAMALFNARRIVLVRTLDQAYATQGMTNSHRAKLKNLIGAVIESLLDDGAADLDILLVYAKYAFARDSGHVRPDDPDLLVSLARSLGIEVDACTSADVPADLEKQVKAALLEQEAREAREAELFFKERMRQAEQYARQRAEPHARGADGGRGQAGQPHPKRAALPSVREIFRKLVSVLHPDRETDAEAHARKTALMQRANQAYQNNDLLQLLEIQIEVAQIDQKDINALDDDQATTYVDALKAQVTRLQHDVAAAAEPFLGRGFQGRATPKAALNELDEEVRDINERVYVLETELAELASPKGIKAWLSSYRIPRPDDEWA